MSSERGDTSSSWEDLLATAPTSPRDIPIRRRRSHDSIYQQEARERRRAPRTQRQREEHQRLLEESQSADSLNGTEAAPTINRLPSTSSFLNINQFLGVFSQEDINIRRWEDTNTQTDDAERGKSKSYRRRWRPWTFLARLLISPIYRGYLSLKNKLKVLLKLLIQVTLAVGISGTVVTWLFYTILFLCISGYWVFYWYMIPQMSHHIPLFFDFDPESNGQQAFACISDFVPKVVELPTASVELMLGDYQWDLLQSALSVQGRARNKHKVKRPMTLKRKKTSSGGSKFVLKKNETKKVKSKLVRSKPTVTTSKSGKFSKFSYQEMMLERIVDWRMGLTQYEKNQRLLNPGEKYDIIVRLRLRNNEHNHKLSNFMIKTDLVTPMDKVIATSKRPAIIAHYKEKMPWVAFLSDFFLIRMVRLALNILFFPFYLLLWTVQWFWRLLSLFKGASSPAQSQISIRRDLDLDDTGEERIILDLTVFEEFQEQIANFISVSRVNVTISQPCIQLWDSTLLFLVKLEGYRYYMYHYKWTCFFFFVVTVFTLEVNYLFLTSCLIATLLWLNRNSARQTIRKLKTKQRN